MTLAFAEKRGKEKIMLIIMVLIGLIALTLISASPAAAQGEITITIDQYSQKADFTVKETISISLTGNFTINEPATRVYFGIYAPEGWETSISPEDASLVTTGETISFEGEVKPTSDTAQEEHKIYVWASIEEKNPSGPDIIESTPSVFSKISIIDVILNRVKVITDTLNHTELPGSTFTHTFTVTNVATVADTFSITILGDEALKDQGWIINQSAETLTLESGETKTFTIEEQIPPDTPKGNYEVEVWISSSGHAASKSTQSLVTKVRLPKISTPFWTLGLFLIIAFVGTGIGLAAFVGATEIGYVALLSLFMPLYVRLKRKDVLSHFTRGQIFGYIQANPGEHYNAIIQHLGLQNGVGAYHLKVLEREGFIKSLKDGIYKRFYPMGVRISEKKLHLSRVQRDILGEIQKHPGITQKQISKLLDESKQVVNYHVKILEAAGLIRLERKGRETACYAGKVRYVAREETYDPSDERSTAPIVNI